MSLPQADADALLALPKKFEPSVVQIDFPRTTPTTQLFTLNAVDRRESFLLDLERGNRKRARLKFQTRARKVFVLARIDIDGRPHTNPPGSPHRPGERFVGPHIHLYRAGFDDRVAFHPHEVPGFTQPANSDPISWLVAFLGLCSVRDIPQIQVTL